MIRELWRYSWIAVVKLCRVYDKLTKNNMVTEATEFSGNAYRLISFMRRKAGCE